MLSRSIMRDIDIGVDFAFIATVTIFTWKGFRSWVSHPENKASKPKFEEFRKTLKRGVPEDIQRLINRGADVNATYPDGRTPLHEAANMGDAKLTELLLNANADVNCTEPYYGQTPLHWATEEGHTDVIQVLLKADSDPNARSKDGETPLFVAAWKGWADAVNILLDAGAQANSQTETGKVPLQMAVEMGHSQVQEVLINAGADLSLIGKDSESKLLKRGLTTRALLDQADQETLDEIPAVKVKSTKEFTKKVSSKVILLGNSGAGKTSLLQTVKEQHPKLTEKGAAGRTIGIELTVLDIDVHRDIHCFVYDFGGQDVYAPLRQTLITPHSLYCLVVDLYNIFQHLNDEECFKTNVGDFYYTVYQHVFSPVFQVIGTKADMLTSDQNEQCCQRITEGLRKIEQREIEILEIRKRELTEAKRAIQNPESKSGSFKFHGLSSRTLDEKILEVDEKMHYDKRPKLPEHVLVVSSLKYTGMKEWKIDIASKILSNKDTFPSMAIPDTWLRLSNSLLQNKHHETTILTSDQFSHKCEKFNIKDKKEKSILIHRLRIVGQILYFENHSSLKNTIFVNPDTILNALSGVFNHEHFQEEFWINDSHINHLPHPTVRRYKQNFQNHGIASKTMMRCFLRSRGVKSNFDDLIELMCKLDLCFKLPRDTSTVPAGLNEDSYIIPSLLQSSPSDDMGVLSPSTKAENIVEDVIGVSVCLNTAREPSGLFEKFTTRIDNHLIVRRWDVAKCMTAEINLYGDKFRLELDQSQKHIRILLLVKYGFGRHRPAVNVMKILITNMIIILSYYPNVLWDLFTLCTSCLASGELYCERLPAEACIFSTSQSQSFYKCYECQSELEIVMGFPLCKAYIKKFRHAAFEDLARGAYSRFGKDWKFMTRFLFSSVDEADQVIEKVEVDSRGRDSLMGLAWQAINKCTQKYDEDATTQRLLAAIHHLNRKDIMDPKNFQSSFFGEEDLKEAAKQFAIEEMACAESVKRGAVKRIVLTVSQEVPDNALRMLHRRLHYYTHTTDEAILVEIDERHDELREKTYQMLRAWRRVALEGATCRLLIKALQETKLPDVARKVEDICQDYEVDIGESIPLE